MPENTIKKNKENEITDKKRSTNFILRFILYIVGGNILTNKKTLKLLPFILFIVLLATLNISNIISVEKKHRKKTNMEKELSKLRAEHSFHSEQVAKNIKPSIITEKLKRFEIKEPNEPIIKIKK